ncbi:MAG: hypothetical protein IKG46_14310 [Solobacterium sp.]|nr:hypothetical protein [Solobacterium sp.]
MIELTDDAFYETLKKYDRCCIDYCLMKDDQPYQEETSHRKAVLFAMEKISALSPSDSLEIHISRAEAVRIDSRKLFAFPDRPWKHNVNGTVLYDNVYEDGKIPYWYAFLEPPHATGPIMQDGKIIRNHYAKEDFDIVNRTLFPMGTDHLVIYSWTTDWSDYFDDGHEWWGAACWSIYDPQMERYAVILVSATD